ncbi:MAG: hypothetical protein ACR2GZ_01335 [Solirubrobacteraceae bacterium]
MNDDWRVRIDLGDGHRARELTDELRAQTLQEDSKRSLHDRVIVSADEGEVFCYTDTHEQAERASTMIEALAAHHSWAAPVELRHWHPTAERWEEPDVPLPADDAARAAERHQRIEQERVDSADQGYPELEVRVQCASHGDANALAERLRDEGIPVVSRWRAVLVGALDEDSAAQLAKRLEAEAPAGSEVTVEGNLRVVYEDGPWRPFAILGGLGG